MKDQDLANMLFGMARHHVAVNHQENAALKEAASRLAQLAAPARLLAFEEIQRLPEHAVVWEEWRGMPEEYRPTDWGCAPVVRIGDGLAGNGVITFIMPGMLDGNEDGQTRWWTAMPSKEQREGTPWTTSKARPLTV